MLLLGLDTATAAVTVGLCDGAGVLAQRTTPDPRRHGELLAPGIAGVLAEAGRDRRELTEVVVGVGPGPFTGLRVGVMTARVLGAALGIPVRGVCTLDVLAGEAAEGLTGRFRVITDARRREVYWAEYDTEYDAATGAATGAERTVRRVSGPHVDRPEAVAWDGPAVGAGARLYPAAFPDARDPALPSAAALCASRRVGLPSLEPLPLYLRRPDAVEPQAPKPVLPQGGHGP